jgi:hypothetical protein
MAMAFRNGITIATHVQGARLNHTIFAWEEGRAIV